MPHDSNFGCLFFSSSPQVSKKVPIEQKLWEEIDYLEIAQFQARAIPPRPIDLRSQPKNYLYGVEISAKSIYSEKSYSTFSQNDRHTDRHMHSHPCTDG